MTSRVSLAFYTQGNQNNSDGEGKEDSRFRKTTWNGLVLLIFIYSCTVYEKMVTEEVSINSLISIQ